MEEFVSVAVPASINESVTAVPVLSAAVPMIKYMHEPILLHIETKEDI